MRQIMTADHDADAEATSYRINNHSDKDNDNHDETRSCTAIPHTIITTTTTTTSDCMHASQNNLSSPVPLTTTTTIATATSTKTIVLDTTAQQQDAVDVVMMVVVIGLPDRDQHHIIDNDENDAIIAHMIPSTMHSLSDPCLQQQQHLHEPNLITSTNIPESKLMAELSSVSFSSTSTSSTSISSSSSSSLSMVMVIQEKQPSASASASSSSLSSAATSVDQDGYVHAVALPVDHHTVQQQAQDQKRNCHNHVGTRSDERDEYTDSAVADVDPELTASQDSMHHHQSLIRKIDPDSPAASSSNNGPTTTTAATMTTTTTTATNTIINSTREDLELLLELPSTTTNKPYVRRARSYSDGLKAVLGASWGNFDDADYIDGNQKNVDGTQQSTNTGKPVVRSCLRSSSTKDVWFNSSALQQQPNRHRPCGQRRKESRDNFAVAAWKRARRRRQQQYLLKQERLRQQKQQQLMKQQQSNIRPRWLIPAEHPFKLLWDILTVLLSFVNAYATHMAIRDRNFGWNNILIRVCECWFVIDILLNFVTEHKISNGMVLNRCQAVWARYLTSWFVIDALSLIPAELLFLQPVIERQNRRGFFQKSFFRTKAVIRMTRVLRGRHLRWFQQMAKHSKRASGIGTQQLLRLIVKYVPKYYFFFHNMKGMVAVRLLRQIHWVRKLYLNVSNRRQQQQQKQPEQLKKSYKEQHLNEDDDDDNETLTTFTFDDEDDEDEGHGEYGDEEEDDDPSFNHSYDDSIDHHSLFHDDDDHNDYHNDDRYYDLMVVDKSCAVAAARGIAMTPTTMGGGVVTTTTQNHQTRPIRNNHDDDVPF